MHGRAQSRDDAVGDSRVSNSVNIRVSKDDHRRSDEPGAFCYFFRGVFIRKVGKDFSARVHTAPFGV